MLRLSQPITAINGFRIGDTVRLKDGDGRPHIIKAFVLDGLKEFFFIVQFEDGTETMLRNISFLKPKESEDEKIREELVYFIQKEKEYMESKVKPENSPKLTFLMDALAYLERQNPKMIQWTGKNLKEVIDFTGKSPKFSEWFKSWEEYENYVHSHGDILKLFCEDGSHYEVPVGAWIVKTPDGFNTPSLFKFVQKSPEWSEEDEEMLRIVINRVEKFNEWATEQGYPLDDPTLKQKPTDWLKALNPHWKPSKEQIEWLELAVRLSTNKPHIHGIIVSLYEQLKKL